MVLANATIGPDSQMDKSSQLEVAHGLQTPFPVRQNRRELARREDPARARAETESPFDPAPVLPAGQFASEDIPAHLPRPILWLAFAGWVVCCGMLFITLVQREPPETLGRAWMADVLLPSGVIRRGGSAGQSEHSCPGGRQTSLASSPETPGVRWAWAASHRTADLMGNRCWRAAMAPIFDLTWFRRVCPFRRTV
jgi:hypothetical protein